MTVAMSIHCTDHEDNESSPDVSGEEGASCGSDDFLLEEPPVEAAGKASLVSGFLPGGFWPRFLALTVDLLLCWLLSAGMESLLMVCAVVLGIDEEAAAYWGEWMGYVVLWVYFGFFTGCCGQTPGKMMLHLKVIRVDGREMGYFRSFLREIMKLFSALPLFLGYAPAAWRADRRALHDFIAKSQVIHV